MRFRKLRIAWSVVCGITCVLLILLWVRSYSRWDEVHWRYNTPNSISLASLAGKMALETMVDSPNQVFAYGSLPERYWGPSFELSSYKFDYQSESRLVSDRLKKALVIPHSAIAVVIILLTTAPWLRWRFSLRTLLIATTLVAVILWAIVYAVK